MQITLNQDEIIDAVVAYVHGQISVAPNQKIEVDLKAGRGENGFTATLDIRPASLGVATIQEASAVSLEARAPSVQAAPVAAQAVTLSAANISAVPAEEPAAASVKAEKPKSGKLGGLFGAKAPEALAPLTSDEPVGVLEEVVESVLPQQDPENTATFSSELDDAPPAEEAPKTSSGIFKFAKG